MSGDPLPEEVDLNVPASVFRLEPPSALVRVRRPGPLGAEEHFEANCATIGGMSVYQGDIWMGPAKTLDKMQAGFFGLTVAKAGYKWPGGVIPYVTDDAVAPIVAAAIAKLRAVTPLVLRPSQGEWDHVSFQVGDMDGSFVGRATGRQVIGLTRGSTVGTALHEICHAFGLWHEQSRPDRDRYIKIHEENIKSGCKPQFDIESTNGTSVGPYDYESIMHYPQNAFAKEGTVTITTRDGRSIGQRTGLSRGDIAALRSLYPALAWR